MLGAGAKRSTHRSRRGRRSGGAAARGSCGATTSGSGGATNTFDYRPVDGAASSHVRRRTVWQDRCERDV